VTSVHEDTAPLDSACGLAGFPLHLGLPPILLLVLRPSLVPLLPLHSVRLYLQANSSCVRHKKEQNSFHTTTAVSTVENSSLVLFIPPGKYGRDICFFKCCIYSRDLMHNYRNFFSICDQEPHCKPQRAVCWLRSTPGMLRFSGIYTARSRPPDPNLLKNRRSFECS
jgi:hypothetical protein